MNSIISKTRKAVLLFAGISYALVAPAQDCAPEGNRILNHSFENLRNSAPADWTLQVFSGNASFTRSEGYAVCGRYYGLLTKSNTGAARVYQDVPIDQASVRVYLSIWAGIHGRANQEIRLRFLNSSGNEMTTGRQSVDVRKVVPGLQKYELSAVIPDGAVKVRVEGRINRQNSSDGNYLKLELASLIFEKDGSLPVTLSQFTAGKQEGGVRVSWQTTQELNSELFEVLHSNNAASWRTLGSVTARGDHEGEASYSFQHDSPAQGNNYYRLRSVDRDGTYTLSNIVNVNVDRIGGQHTVFYPNPSRGMLNFSAERTIREVRLFDAAGLEVLNDKAVHSGKEISLASLNSGTYLLKWVDETGESAVQRIVLDK